MLLKKLTVYDIFDEGTFSVDFETKKNYRKKDVEKVSASLSYAFFGEPVLAHGKVELSFNDGEDRFLIRDFKENKAFLQKKGDVIENEEIINEYFVSLLGMNKSHWESFFLVKEKELYENSFENTGDYFSSVLNSLAIDKEKSEQAADRFKKKLADFGEQDALLAGIASSYDVDGIRKDVEALTEEIAALHSSVAETEKIIVLGEKSEEIAEEYKKADEEYKKLLSTQKDVEKMRKLLARSSSVSSHVGSLRKAASIIAENDELSPLLKQKKEALDEKIKETEAGERVLKKKQSSYSELAADIRAHYVALVERIDKNASADVADKGVVDGVNKRFASLDKKLFDLQKKESDLLQSLKMTEKDIAVYTRKYQNIHLAQVFDKLWSFNRAQLDKSSERLSSITSEKGETTDEYLARFHELEKKKDELFRGYILSDNLLKDIEAIDGKVGENNAAINSQQENLDALENAKETLTQYLEKCRKKVDAADAELLKLGTRKQYYSEIDALEYGDHCPVCNMPVIDKADNTFALQKLEAQIKKQNDDIASYRNVLTEYTEKLEEINLRIGSLRAKINTSKGYVNSLQQSKLTKIAMLEKIYAEAGVNDRDQLVTLMEDTVKEVARTAAAANELNGLVSSSFIAEENIAQISSYLKELAGEDGNSALTLSRKKLASLEEKHDLPVGTLSGKGETDGDAYNKLQEAVERKKSIEKELGDVRGDILACQGRDATVSEEGKELTYGELCISYAGKIYSSVIKTIREKEERRQKLVGEIAALTGVLKDKRTAIEEETEEIRMLENRFQNNLDYLETIKIEDDFDESSSKKKSVADWEKEILSEGDADAMRRVVNEFDEQEALLGARCKTLSDLLSDVIAPTALSEKRVELRDLLSAIDEKGAALERLKGLSSLQDALREKRDDLRAEAKLYDENYSFLTHVFDDGAVILKDTVNYALMSILPRYTAECKGSGLILKDGKRTLTSISDEVYSVVLVALADAFRYVISGILDCPDLIRMVTLKASSVSDDVKKKIDEYAASHNIVVLYTR